LLAATVAPAHHSVVAEYDVDRPVSIRGEIKRVEWQNPHIWYYIDVKDKDGAVSEWGVSGGAPGQLMRRGITKDVLQIGAVVSVEGFQARDGSKNMTGRQVTFSDGRNVFTAGPEPAR
jgi:DNA/RNA endonuclease YhcR with UshA esterase domain